ncbi:MAG: hypothetical protein KBS76_07680, partial [Ruminococcus sp.]|nr:hypothetical protein [Candidatus Apopatosoma intestinale]
PSPRRAFICSFILNYFFEILVSHHLQIHKEKMKSSTFFDFFEKALYKSAGECYNMPESRIRPLIRHREAGKETGSTLVPRDGGGSTPCGENAVKSKPCRQPARLFVFQNITLIATEGKHESYLQRQG